MPRAAIIWETALTRGIRDFSGAPLPFCGGSRTRVTLTAPAGVMDPRAVFRAESRGIDGPSYVLLGCDLGVWDGLGLGRGLKDIPSWFCKF